MTATSTVVRLARQLGWALFGLACLGQLVALYWPVPPDAPDSMLGIPQLDKIVHVVVFAAVACTGRLVRLPAWILGTVLVAHAAISELVQGWFLPRRAADLADVAADLGGVAVGLLLGHLLLRLVRVERAETP